MALAAKKITEYWAKGDLITANKMNNIYNVLNGINERLDYLYHYSSDINLFELSPKAPSSQSWQSGKYWLTITTDPQDKATIIIEGITPPKQNEPMPLNIAQTWKDETWVPSNINGYSCISEVISVQKGIENDSTIRWEEVGKQQLPNNAITLRQKHRSAYSKDYMLAASHLSRWRYTTDNDKTYLNDDGTTGIFLLIDSNFGIPQATTTEEGEPTTIYRPARVRIKFYIIPGHVDKTDITDDPSNDIKDLMPADLSQITKFIAEIKQTMYPTIIDYWGDSQTAGTGGGNGISPKALMKSYFIQTQQNEFKVNSLAAGGEFANTIACRAGAIRFMVQPGVTIPASGSVVITANKLLDEFGNYINIRTTTSNNINPVTIAGIEGTITSNSASNLADYQFTFTRASAGQEVTITQPTPMITNSSKENCNHISIIMMGQNQDKTADNDPIQATEDLIQLYKAMVEKNGNDRYLIIGLTTKDKQELNKALHHYFGRHFIDLRNYLIQYGLNYRKIEEPSFEPTSQDEEDINQDNVPHSLLSDETHGNDWWYKIRNKLEIERGREFGWWK